MAQLEGTQTYDKRLRRDMQELAANMWLGMPLDGQKAGNLRAVYMVFSLPSSANATFGLEHELGEEPLGYVVIGTPTTHVVELSPGVDAASAVLPWTAKHVYLKSPKTDITVCILIWGTDSSGG